MNLELTDRTRWDATEVGGLYVHVVEGVPTCQLHDPCDCTSYHGLPHCKVGCGHNTAVSGLLRELLALSEQKCQTCGGLGHRGMAVVNDRAIYIECTDCLGSGRQDVEVTVPCDQCHGDGECPVPCTPSVHQVGVLDYTLGRLSIGKGTVEGVVPIERVMPRQDVAPGTNQYAAAHDRITVHPMSGEAYYWHDGNGRAVSGVNASHVGTHYGVIVRRQP